MTDLPYGRGGSPLQNLIANKIYDTKISAIRAEGGIDTGRIYLKEVPIHWIRQCRGNICPGIRNYIYKNDPLYFRKQPGSG